MPNNESDRRQAEHNNNVAIAAASTLMFFAGFFIGGALSPSSQEKTWFYDYQSFVGSTLGGIAAMIAAYMAWKSIQKQILIQIELADRPSTAAKKFIEESTREALSKINAIWEHLEQPYKSSGIEELEKQIRNRIIASNVSAHSLGDNIKEIERRFDFAMKSMSLDDSFRFLDVLSFLKAADREIKNSRERISSGYFLEKEKNAMDLAAIEGLKITFSHLDMACSKFSKRLHDIFESRNRLPVKWDPESNQITKFLKGQLT